MPFFLQRSEILRPSPQETFAYAIFLHNFDLYKILNSEPFFEEVGCVSAIDHCILLFAFDFRLFVRIVFQILMHAASL